MHLARCNSRGTLDVLAADRVNAVLARKPHAALALPTGQTPVGLYALLSARAAAGAISFARTWLFNLDEYVGLAPDHPRSYGRFLGRHLLERVDVADKRVRLLRGDASDLAAECRSYDAAIAKVGGIDLAILGLGANGHIAFNEPGADSTAGTHVVALSAQTRAVHQRQAGGIAKLPRRGLTMGVRTLASAREILLLVAGTGKQRALQALLRGRATPRWPVTYLHDHPHLTVLSAP